MVRKSHKEKCPFHLGQGMSGKLGKLAMVRGKLALFYCRSGK